MDSLPEEIVIYIFSRLLAESVWQCTFVCKTWRNLIYSDKSLANMHSRLIHDQDSVAAVSSGKASFIEYFNSHKLLKYVQYDDDDNSEEPMTFEIINFNPPNAASCEIVGSCNGLICMSVFGKDDIFDPIYICNPMTKEYVFLPELSVKNVCYFKSGFGYHPSINEYKVVRIYSCVAPSENIPFVGHVQVYTLGSGCGWRNIGKINYEFHPTLSSEIFANGALHWLDKQGNIVAFDLADEKFHVLPTRPDCMNRLWDKYSEGKYGDPIWSFELSVLSGYLCITDESEDDCDNICIFQKSDDHDNAVGKLQNQRRKEGKYNSSWIWTSKSTRTISIYTRMFAYIKDRTILCYDEDNYFRKDLSQPQNKDYECIGRDHTPNGPVRYVKSFVSLKALGEEDAKIMKSSEDYNHPIKEDRISDAGHVVPIPEDSTEA